MKSTLVEQNHLRNYIVACPIEIAGIVVIPAIQYHYEFVSW